MNTTRAVFRGAGWRRALHKAGSRAFPGAVPAGGGKGAGGGARRQLASMSLSKHHDHEYVGLGLLASLGLVILSGYGYDDELPSRLVEKLQQQSSSANAVWPLRRIDEVRTSNEVGGRGKVRWCAYATKLR